MQRKLLIISLLLLLTAVLSPFLWRAVVEQYYRSQMYTVAEAPPARVAIVFGARIYADGRLSAMLRDRVETAVQLYHDGKVEKIIFSGDNRFENYNEPGAMMAYARRRGVPDEAMQPDYAGRRTYDTCYRAREIFGVDTAVLVTQEFHLPRALFTCDSLGLNVTGVIADRQAYARRSINWSQQREIAATAVALIDVIRRAPPPVLGEPIPLE
jgi:SanA protein